MSKVSDTGERSSPARLCSIIRSTKSWLIGGNMPDRSTDFNTQRPSCSNSDARSRAHAEQRRLDGAQAAYIRAHTGDDVVEQERLGEAHDREAERRRVDRRVVRARRHLVLDERSDPADEVGVDDARAGGDHTQGQRTLELDEGAQRGRRNQIAVEAIEGVEQRAAPAPTSLAARGVQQRVRSADEDLAEQSLPATEPAIQRRPAESELRGDRLQVHAATA